jgi:hypothetical protein
MPRAVENSKPNQQFIASCRRSPALQESSSHQALCWRKVDSNQPVPRKTPGIVVVSLLVRRLSWLAGEDQACLRRRAAAVGRSAASSVFRLRPPLTGSNKAG